MKKLKGKNEKGKLQKLYDQILFEFNKSKIGYEALAILGQSSLGGIAAMFILKNNIHDVAKIVMLLVVSILTMGFNSIVLINWKARPTLNILITSVLFSILMIIVNLI